MQDAMKTYGQIIRPSKCAR